MTTKAQGTPIPPAAATGGVALLINLAEVGIVLALTRRREGLRQ